MSNTQQEFMLSYTDILPDLAKLLPSASGYMLEALAYNGTFESVPALTPVIESVRKDLALKSGQLDDLVINIILLQQSPRAALRHVEVYNSARALNEIAETLALSQSQRDLLNTHYASLASQKLFTEVCDPLLDADKAAFSKTIDSLIESANKIEKHGAHNAEENKEYAAALYKDKKIPFSLHADLGEIYGISSAPDLAAKTEELLKKLSEVNDNPAQNAVLAVKVLLYIMTEAEALSCAEVAKAIKYPLLDDDLQTITFKYIGLKNPKETAEIFDAVLSRLPYLDDPVENLSLAVRVVADARPQTLENAEASAARRKGKVLFMRKLSADKFFNGYEDELTAKFFGANTIEEVSSMFHHILRELPHTDDIYENAAIAVKVLLKKLPLKDAVNQALFQKENKISIHVSAALGGADAVEEEAFESYLGTKSKEEVVAFFKERLNPFDFWRGNEEAHCYALTALVGELNGKISSASADLALNLLQASLPEESVTLLTEGLSEVKDLDEKDVLRAYEKFYKQSKSHADAAKRVINMMQ